MADRFHNTLMRLLSLLSIVTCVWACPDGKPLGAAAPLPPVSEYASSQGQNVTGAAAPYVDAYARASQIDLRSLSYRSALPGPNMFVISSADAMTGDWTYFSSATTRIFELRRVGECILMLSSPSAPSAGGHWTLSLFNPQYRLRSQVHFRTTPKRDGPIDSITTKLAVREDGVDVTIIYAHAGGGEPGGQRFTVKTPYARRFGKPVIAGPLKDD